MSLAPGAASTTMSNLTATKPMLIDEQMNFQNA